MPLDFKEKGDISEKKHNNEGPILHQPGELKPGISKIMIILFLVVIIIATTFFLIKYDVFKRIKSQQTMNVETPSKSNEPKVENQFLKSAPSNDDSTTSMTKGNEVPIPINEHIQEKSELPVQSENYTIYIARHHSKEIADQEAERWKEAGYETTVTEYDGWYRVSIGRFSTWDEAKAVAEKLHEGFEAGYRVGKIIE